MRVLLVESDDDLRAAYDATLRGAGFDVDARS